VGPRAGPGVHPPADDPAPGLTAQHHRHPAPPAREDGDNGPRAGAHPCPRTTQPGSRSSGRSKASTERPGLAAGAAVHARDIVHGHLDHVVMLDPEGNEFCLV